MDPIYDKSTMTIWTSSPKFAEDMERVATQIILKGEIPNPFPNWAEQWLVENGFTDSNKRLIFISTVFPQRILLSVVQYRNRLEQRERLDRLLSSGITEHYTFCPDGLTDS